ncbi:MAG: hypothetical protein AABW47_02690, partial [Nanoarchaeota archaeon]
DVDRIILVTVPNHGVSDKVKDYCSVLGPKITCDEMNENSTFIYRLNNLPSEFVSTFNIIGTGCNMGDETGDGIIKNLSQYLPSAINYNVDGICNELNFEFLHEYIIYPNRYPETYTIIDNAIKQKL